MGTNALRMLLVQVEPAGKDKNDGQISAGRFSFTVLERSRLTTGLGQGLAASSAPCLQPAAQARTRAALAELRQRAAGAEQIILLATHACRQALNGEEFVRGLAETFELSQARIISAREEARLTRLGVGCFLQGDREKAWVLDIGAGSCELVPLDGQGEGLYLPWGCLTLKEKLAPGEPPVAGELAALRAFLAPYLLNRGPARRLVLTSGTAGALAAMDLGLSVYEPELINNHIVSGQRLAEILEALSRQNLSQRRLSLGPAADRAEIIVIGLLIAREILTALALQEATVLGAGLMEGYLSDYLGSL
jgi:exopolyphosphatase/guanosine-5'-triphosphate,3'-diphosphate pyrophosphatase